jgi:membrane peptidoglycan carboxypeptidase
LLVGVLRAPSDYDPFVNPEASRQRRNDVIQNLVDVGKLTQAQADKYKATPVSLSTASPPPQKQTCANSTSSIPNVGFFCDYVVNWLTTTGGITNIDTAGLNVRTTIDANLQASTQAQISAAIPANSPMTAVLPVIDPRTGDITAMATSKKYGNKTSEKDVTHTTLPIFTDYTASGASTYKLFPLLMALSAGIPSTWALGTPPNNAAYVPSNCLTDSGVTNADAKVHYSSNETLASATAKSSNTYFVQLVDQLLNCNLQPVIDIAKQLGMKSFDQPSGEGNSTIGDAIVANQRAAQLVLGAVGTSPLELTGAYAGIANDGYYNAPSPVISITDSNGNQVAVKRPVGVQVVSAQVARQAVQILTGDTVTTGTSAAPFASWYSTNPSLVAGKTGTSVAVVSGKDSTQNASLWFVGMTPKYVATSALINFDHPNDPAAGLPNVTNPGVNAYGEYASGVWLKALQPSIQSQTWAWPSPLTVEGSPVPIQPGMTIEAATAAAKDAGYKLQQLGGSGNDRVTCPSSQAFGTVAYFAPQIAPQGSTITVCASTGYPQATNATPSPTKPKPPTSSSRHSSSSHSSTARTTPHSSSSPRPNSSTAPTAPTTSSAAPSSGQTAPSGGSPAT